MFKRPLVSGEIHNDSNALSNGKELARSWQGVGKELGLDYKVLEIIGEYCREERSLAEIAQHLGLADRYKMKKKYIDPLLGKYLKMTCPDTVNIPQQKYYLTEIGKALSDKEFNKS